MDTEAENQEKIQEWAAAASLEEHVTEALKSIYDPEIPVNIYELGLIYSVDLVGEGDVRITMTLTSPACPVAGSLPGEVEMRVMDVPGVKSCEVEIVWDPQWNPSMMSEAARLELGLL
jgi:FeS assembly SUF system protein